MGRKTYGFESPVPKACMTTSLSFLLSFVFVVVSSESSEEEKTFFITARVFSALLAIMNGGDLGLENGLSEVRTELSAIITAVGGVLGVALKADSMSVVERGVPWIMVRPAWGVRELGSRIRAVMVCSGFFLLVVRWEERCGGEGWHTSPKCFLDDQLSCSAISTEY